MAEFVDRRMERALQELEQMVKVGLFTSDEIKSIVTKRMKIEYSVGRHGKTVEDHLKYVKYEMSFLELIKLRRKRLGYDFKINEIEGSVGKRCQLRLMRAENRYPGSMEIWNVHLDLCRALKWNPVASQVFTRMLQIHSDKPEVWIQAADFELNENGSPDNARELCLKALRWHEKNEDIWRHYLMVELRIAGKVFQRGDILGVPVETLMKGEEPIATGKVARVVVKNALRTVPDLDFAASLFHIIQNAKNEKNKKFEKKNFEKKKIEKKKNEFFLEKKTELFFEEIGFLPEEFFSPLLEFLLQKMEEMFGEFPSFWKRRAQFFLLFLEVQTEEMTEEEVIKSEQAAFAVLDSVVQKNDADASMWGAYFDFFTELYAKNERFPDIWTRLQMKRFEKAQDVFLQAEKNDAVDFHRHLSWAQICLSRRRTEDALTSLGKAAAAPPTSLDDFVRLIRLYSDVTLHSDVTPAETKYVLPLIQKAKETLSKNDPEVWRCLIEWTEEYFEEEENVENVFKEALRQTRPVVMVMSLPFLQWAYGRGLAKGRSVWEVVRRTPCALTEGVVKWVLGEEMKRRTSIGFLRKILDEGVRVHGVESPDLWIDYIQMELSYPGGDAFKSSQIVWKAQRTLKPEAVSLFMSMYNLIITDENAI